MTAGDLLKPKNNFPQKVNDRQFSYSQLSKLAFGGKLYISINILFSSSKIFVGANFGSNQKLLEQIYIYCNE